VSAHAVADLATEAGDKLIDVVDLLDEEVVLLDGPGADHVAPHPWFGALAPEQQETALAVAARGLVVRGVVTPAAMIGQSGDVSMETTAGVHAVLSARRASAAVLMAQRRTAEASSFQAIYLRRDGFAVVEEVSPGGPHSFRAGALTAAVQQLALFCDPQGVEGVDGAVRSVDLTDVSRGRGFSELTTALWVTVVTAVLPPAQNAPEGAVEDVVERRLSVYAGRDYLRVAVPSVVGPVLDIRDVSRETLASVLTDLLAPAGGRP
jgi:hypothetical protein